jgi:hypothetical protein
MDNQIRPGLPCPLPPVWPVDVWDTRDYETWWNRWGGKSPGFMEALDWAMKNIGNLNTCYRIEFYVFDTAFCVVFRYAEYNGNLVASPPTGEATKCDPVIQFVSSFPFPYEAAHG